MMQMSHYVTDWLDKRARLTPDRVALVDYASGVALSYAEWNARANQTANYLRSLGVEKGDRVAVYASNCPQYLDLFWAAPKIGAVLQNLNWRLTVHELQGIVDSGEPRVFIYSKDWRTQTAELKPSFRTVEHVVVPSGYESKYPYDPSGKMAGGAEEFDLPDPLIWLTWVAAKTTRIKLAPGVVVIPLYHPVRLMSEIGMVSAMSHGRLVLGIGSGYQPYEFDRFDEDLADSTEKLIEFMEMMELAFENETFSFDGKHFKIPETHITTRPAAGMPDVWVAGDNPMLGTFAARKGYASMVTPRSQTRSTTSGCVVVGVAMTQPSTSSLPARSGRLIASTPNSPATCRAVSA